jgi:NAD+ kinase
MSEIYYEVKPADERASAIAKRLEVLLSDLDLGRPLVVAVGGDGTMLHAVRQHSGVKNALFVGISAGHLGFIQAVESNELEKFVEILKMGKYVTVRAPLISVKDDSGHIFGYGFNEVLIERKAGYAVKFDLNIDGSKGRFIGDGVIFAAPLGSTSYALAAGGPIIDTALQNVFLVVPSNPHISLLYTSLQRPHVLAGNRDVRIEMTEDDIKYHPAKLAIDGRVALEHINRPLTVFLSDKYVDMLQLADNGFYHRLEKKRLGRL